MTTPNRATASSRRLRPLPEARVRRIRRVLELALVASVLACALGMLPGKRVYADASNCFGAAFLIVHGGARDCTPSYSQLTETRRAGGPALLAAVAVLLVPGILAYRRPRRLWAAALPLLLVAVAIGVFYLTWSLDLFVRVEVLWPTHVVSGLVGVVSVLIGIGLPLATFVGRDAARLPRARVI